MKQSNRTFLAGVFPIMLMLIAAPFASAQVSVGDTDTTTAKVRALFVEIDKAFTGKDADALMKKFDVIHSLAEATKQPREKIAHNMVTKKDWTEYKSTVTGVQSGGELTIARIDLAEKWREKAGEKTAQTKLIYFLKSREGQFVVENYAEAMGKDEFDPATHSYQSSKGHYTVQLPEEWFPVKNMPGVPAIIPDMALFIGPDTNATVFLGFVQMPFKIDPRQGAAGDVAVEKNATQNHKMIEQGEITVAGQKAWRVVTDFNAQGKHIRRMRVYFGAHPMLYFFLCDVDPAEQFDNYKDEFTGIVQSFKMVAPKGGQTVQQAVAGQLAQGTISGRNYTNKQFNCFISAPAGWTIRTSPNPSHLVEMQPANSKSLVRVLAAKGLKPDDTAKTTFEGRLAQLKAVVKDFKETSRSDVTIQNCAGIESTQSYTLEGLGKFEVKEVTLVRDGVYYLILCQAIEPDQLKALEPQFDEVINSFGFVQ